MNFRNVFLKLLNYGVDKSKMKVYLTQEYKEAEKTSLPKEFFLKSLLKEVCSYKEFIEEQYDEKMMAKKKARHYRCL